jgi:hypothetical protein
MTAIQLGALGKLTASSRIGMATSISQEALSPIQAMDFARVATMGDPRAMLAAAQASASAPVDATQGDLCGCYLSKAAEFAMQARGTPLSENEQGQLLAQCASDPAVVAGLLAEAGVSTESCKPWYMRRTTWIYGGVGVAALVGVSLLFGGRK